MYVTLINYINVCDFDNLYEFAIYVKYQTVCSGTVRNFVQGKICRHRLERFKVHAFTEEFTI